MNNDILLLMLLVYGAPVVSGLLSIAFLYLGANRTVVGADRKLRKLLTAYFFTVAVNWIFALMLVFAPAVVAHLNGLVYSLLLLVQVFLYHYLYILTGDTGEKPFGWWHYGLPVVVFTGLTVWSLLIPPEAHIASIAVPGKSDFAGYNAVVRSKPLVRALYSLVYSLLAIRCILRYRRRIVDFSAEADNLSADWLLFIIILVFPLFLTPAVAALISPYKALMTFLGAFPALGMFIQLPVLCYYTVTHRYVLMIQADTTDSDQGTMAGAENIGRQQLDRFMASSKPYLKPDLKITDLAEPLKTNRSYLSAFINSTYGMNFSQFINGYRLRELERMIKDPELESLTNLELIHKAGFGSYHSYYRSKKQEDKRRMLSVDG